MGSSHSYGTDFYRTFSAGSRASAEAVVPLVLDLLAPASVVDVGCGIGLWLAEFKRHGLRDVLGVDFGRVPPTELAIGPGEFVAHDLTRPLELGRRFDLAVSVEVAEHLPEGDSRRFVADLVGLAPAVLFSAAVPHQGGVGHVNEQWPEYWAERFVDHGYVAVDALRCPIWANPSVEFWYAQNLLLFVEGDELRRHEKLEAAARATDPGALARVHPTLYLASVEAARRPWRSWGGRASGAVRRAAARTSPGRLRARSAGAGAPPSAGPGSD